MQKEVRDMKGGLLFKWEPEENTVEILRGKKLMKVKLNQAGGTYRVYSAMSKATIKGSREPP
jgi:hypothetical protein